MSHNQRIFRNRRSQRSGFLIGLARWRGWRRRLLLTLLALLSTVQNGRRSRQSLRYGIRRTGTLDDESTPLPRRRYRSTKRSAYNRPTGIHMALSMCPPCHAPDPMRMVAAAALTPTRRRRLLRLGRPDAYLDHVADLQPNLGLLRLLALL